VIKQAPMSERELAAFAKKCRKAAGKTRAQAARELDVSNPSVFQAEESPDRSMFKLRKRLIEKYSSFRVRGPVYLLEGK
jgi:DNA-binding XRE family transcriptional regulator